ncbi:hypothetical protein [Marivivens marinus]|uniref:hypothetical protein n=1 Tax=Marivivens marinus TaxID=3110173 RepID=UPI003B8492EF
MAEFLRPEARAALWRWRELLTALSVLALGLWWGLTSFGVLQWIGWALTLAAVLLAIAGLQKGRFRRGGGGAGIVTIDERRLVYYGPLSGGVMEMGDLTSLEYDPTGTPPHWVLRAAGQEPLFVPVNAEGADDLFDLFSALPGMRTQDLLDVLSRTGPARVVIWRRTAALLH